MDESIKHKIKQSYNRLSALLVFIANAFTLMYVGGMQYNDALWFGSVSGAFTYTILSTIADSQDLEDFAERKRPSRFSNAMNYMENKTGWDMNRDGHVGQPIPPNMIPYQQFQQQQQMPMPMPAQAGGYINPNTGELLEAEQGPHIDKMAKKGKK
tara:strand:- start:1095 stop:1559 length:465 start_codon:yes stop_codon:yes gene_type:complete